MGISILPLTLVVCVLAGLTLEKTGCYSRVAPLIALSGLFGLLVERN